MGYGTEVLYPNKETLWDFLKRDESRTSEEKTIISPLF